MEKKTINILNDDKQLETVLQQAMEHAGERQDHARIDAMKEMSEDEFLDMLCKIKTEPLETDTATKAASIASAEEKPLAPVKPLFLRPIFLRAIAACAVLVLILVGINYIEIGGTKSSGYASLFNTYYKGDKENWQKYEASDDKLNAEGGLSTAGILEEATWLMSKKNASSNKKGIERLEYLLTLNYKKSLEHEIRWYLGLGYLRDGQIGKAREEFERVISLNSPHKSDAEKILKEL